MYYNRVVPLHFPLLVGCLAVSTTGCNDGTSTSPFAAPTSALTEKALTVSSIGSEGGTSVQITAPPGVVYTSVTVDEGPGFQASNILAGVQIFGLTGTASSASAPECTASGQTGCLTTAAFQTQSTPTNPAIASEVLSGKGFYTGGSQITGTMTQHGALDITQAFPGPGYVSSITGLTASRVCSSANYLGTAGSAVCETGTTSNAAGAGDLFSGKEAWDGTGAKLTGTIVNRGNLDVSSAWPGMGYYGSTPTHVPAASSLCSDISILGVSGSKTCPQIYLASNAARDAGVIALPSLGGGTTSNQLSLNEEVITYGQASGGASLPNTGGYNYREIPDKSKDDDGATGTSVTYVLRPTVACGSSGTIAARIADCATKNPSRSSWDGAVNGIGGEGLWKLVVATGQTTTGQCTGKDCKEVWQDTRTGLIWSSAANGSATTNWCKASGNKDLAPVSLNQIYNTAAGTTIIGNGSISAITGGSNSTSEIITVTMTGATTFTVSGTNCGGGSISAGGLTGTAGSSVTWSRTGFCSFTLTQGSIPFSNNDKFVIVSYAASTYSCVPGAASGLQSTNPISFCAEQTGYYPGFTSGTWGDGDSYTSGWAAGQSYTYDQAKGGMGRTSPNPVYWRLPTRNDYLQAEVDGIRFVMPDMGLPSTSRSIPDGSPGSATNAGTWSATVDASNRTRSTGVTSSNLLVSSSVARNIATGFGGRCVGR